MSTESINTEFDAAFAALVESTQIDPTTTPEEAPVVTTTPSKSSKSQSTPALIARVVATSATLSSTEEQAAGLADGFEATFVAFLSEFATAIEAGATESDVRKALQADQKASGTKHIAASAAGCSLIHNVAKVAALSGDLPTSWVWRPDGNAAVGLREGEYSIHALVRKVTTVGGVAAVRGCFAEGTKEGFVVAAQSILREAEKAEREAAAAAKGPKTAEKFLKAASGPIGKVSEALDAGHIGDPAEVLALIAALEATLAEAKAHTALK
jgi:predicted transcriptional regulator